MIDTRPLTTRLLSEASQENCDGVEHDLMMEAYHRITSLEQQVKELQNWKSNIKNLAGTRYPEFVVAEILIEDLPIGGD